MDDTQAAENYVDALRDRAQPGWRKNDDLAPVDWGDGDLLDAFLAGVKFATANTRKSPA